MKVKLFSVKEYETDYLIRSNNGKHELCFESKSLSIENIASCKGFEAISVFTNDDLSARILEKLHEMNIHYIAIRATGYDHADLARAEQLNVRIANVPEYSPYSVAEQAIMLILALNRKVITADKQVKQYNFTLNNLIGFNLYGKTVGIIGLGRIGAALAGILKGFGCKILAFDTNESPTLISKYNIQYCTMAELLSQSDIISLHIPLSDKTKYIINEYSISLMKKNVMLINTGRGGLVHTEDVLKGIKSGKIGYFGMDVYEREKGLFFNDKSNELIKDNILLELMSLKNVIITPHQGFLTNTALQDIAETTFYNINCWAAGQKSNFEIISVHETTITTK